MNVEELKIGDKVRYETYYGGTKLNAFGIIDSELEQDYYRIKNIITHKQELRHHKNSIIAKVIDIGGDYKEIRIETGIRRFSADDIIAPFAFGDACNHCIKCGTSSMMGEYYVENFVCKKCRDKCCKCGEYSVYQDKSGNYFCEDHIPIKQNVAPKSIKYELEPYKFSNFKSSYCKDVKMCNGWIYHNGGYKNFRELVVPDWMEMGKIYEIEIREKSK